MVGDGGDAWHLLSDAMDPLGPRPQPARSGVLIDMAHRRFYFFWIEIWPHEFYFVAGLLIMAGGGVVFVFTGLWGGWGGGMGEEKA